MSPAAIAALCGFAFSPPAPWDAMPMPVGARVIEVPMSQIDVVCRTTDGATTQQVASSAGRSFGPVASVTVRMEYGCATGLTAYVPSWSSWPGTRECWLEDRRHEVAHLKGWKHPMTPSRRPA